MSQSNNLLIYVTEYIIDEGNKSASDLTMLGVYKLLFLMNQRLREEHGINMKLPYSWYKYGPMVERDEYFMATGNNLQDYFNFTDYSAVNHVNLRCSIKIGEEVVRWIQSIFSDFVRRYTKNPTGAKCKWNVDLMIQDVYEKHAPYEFQRMYVLDLKREFWKYSVPEIVTVLDRLFVVFPEDDLEDIYMIYLRWDDTFRLALRAGVSNNAITKEFISEFWKVFAAKIRCLKNENVTGADFGKWTFSEKLKAFQIWMSQVREILLLNLPESSLSPDDARLLDDLNAVAFNEAVETVRR